MPKINTTIGGKAQSGEQSARAHIDKLAESRLATNVEDGPTLVEHPLTLKSELIDKPLTGKQCFVHFHEARRTISVDLAIFSLDTTSLLEHLTSLCPAALPPISVRHGLVLCHKSRVIKGVAT